MESKIIRVLDITISLSGLFLLSPFLLALLIFGWADSGSPLFIQTRVGKGEKTFKLLKFRSMRRGTPSTASHLVKASNITRYGRFLRISKLDELPQLVNVLIGHMSLVGARPCLPSQSELVELRKEFKIFRFRPGITGLAQINNIDMSNPTLLVAKETEMYLAYGVKKYIFYVFCTITGSGRGDAVPSD